MKKKHMAVIFCAVCMMFILYNSSQTSEVSNSRSYGIVDSIEKLIAGSAAGKLIFSRINYVHFNLFIRKCAHGFEFFLFSLAVCSFMSSFKKKISDIIVYTAFTVLFLAVIDEYFQLFIKNRTSSVADVLIDFIGGLIGIILCLIFSKRNNENHR